MESTEKQTKSWDVLFGESEGYTITFDAPQNININQQIEAVNTVAPVYFKTAYTGFQCILRSENPDGYKFKGAFYTQSFLLLKNFGREIDLSTLKGTAVNLTLPQTLFKMTFIELMNKGELPHLKEVVAQWKKDRKSEVDPLNFAAIHQEVINLEEKVKKVMVTEITKFLNRQSKEFKDLNLVVEATVPKITALVEG